MIAADLLSTLATCGVTLFLDGGKLRYRSPKGACTPELRRLVGEHRRAILSHLAGDELAEGPGLATDPPERPAPRPGGGCRCGSMAYRDVVLDHNPHNGQSARRDCARCGRFLDFPRWYGAITP